MNIAPTLPYAFARRHGVLVTAIGTEHADVLLREDASLAAVAEVRRHLGLPLNMSTTAKASFDAHLAETYSAGDGSAAEIVADVGLEVDLAQLMTELPAVEDLLESQDDAPVIRMINALLTQAVREAASDVHIEPYEHHSVVRLRRDGVLRDIARPHRGLHADHELARAERLGQEVVTADRERAIERLDLALGRDEHDRDLIAAGQGAEFLADGDAVHPRHADIEEDAVGALGLERRERGRAIAGEDHAIRLVIEGRLGERAVLRVVVDDKYGGTTHAAGG